MKINFTLVTLSLFLLINCKQAPQSDEAKVSDPKQVTTDTTSTTSAETLVIDGAQSKIEWVGTKVSGYHSGTVPIKSGEVMVGDGKVTGGRFVIDMAALTVTGPKDSKPEANAKLQKHLLSADFFEASTYPEGVFEITEVKPYTGQAPTEENDPRQEDINEYKVTNPTHMVSGNLTIKNTTKNIEFPARINVTADFAEAVAKFNIDRTQWNINYPGQKDDLIRNEIHLGISVMASRPKS